MTTRSARLILLALLLSLQLTGCGEHGNGGPIQEIGDIIDDTRQSISSTSELLIAVPWTDDSSGLVDGVRLAANEINEYNRNNGIERRYKIMYFNESVALSRADVDRESDGSRRNAAQDAANALANRIIGEKNLFAVIGHNGYAGTPVPAAITYFHNNTFFFSPNSTDPLLNVMDSNFTFQMIPPSQELARQTTRFMLARGYREILIIHARDTYSQQIATFIDKSASEIGQHITFTGSIPSTPVTEWSSREKVSSINLLAEALDHKFDAVFLVGSPLTVRIILREARRLGITQPVVSTDLIDSPVFLYGLEEFGENTLIASTFDGTTYLARKFLDRFRSAYPDSGEPDNWAAIGYDTLTLIENTLRCSDSTSSVVISNTLRYNMPLWYGVSGAFEFNNRGINTSKRFIFKELVRDPDQEMARFVTIRNSQKR